LRVRILWQEKWELINTRKRSEEGNFRVVNTCKAELIWPYLSVSKGERKGPCSEAQRRDRNKNQRERD